MNKLGTSILIASSVLVFGCMPESAAPASTGSTTTGGTTTGGTTTGGTTTGGGSTTVTAPVHGKTVLITDNSGIVVEDDPATPEDEEVSGDTGELRFKLETEDALAAGKFSVDVWLAEGETQTVKISVFGSSASNSKILGEIRIDENYADSDGFAGIRLTDDETYGDEGITVSQFATDAWVNLAITWETGSSTYNILIDDVAQASYSMENEIASAQYFVVKIASNNGEADLDEPLYIDNFSIFSDTSGSTVVFQDDFESYDSDDDLASVTDTPFHGDSFSAAVSDAFVE